VQRQPQHVARGRIDVDDVAGQRTVDARDVARAIVKTHQGVQPRDLGKGVRDRILARPIVDGDLDEGTEPGLRAADHLASATCATAAMRRTPSVTCVHDSVAPLMLLMPPPMRRSPLLALLPTN